MVGPRRCPERIPAVPLMLAFAAFAAFAASARGSSLPACEPGFPMRDGSWILPVPVSVPRSPGSEGTLDSLKVWTAGRSLPVVESITFAPREGGRPVAVVVLFDALRGDDGQPVSPAPWASSLRRRLAGPGIAVVGGRCGPKSPKIPDGSDAVAENWPTTWTEAGARLWDGVLEALTVLSEMDEPDRRLLILVSDGREEFTSEHVLASCLDAAARARVPVYVLGAAAGADREADEARLRDLAVQSGGWFVADGAGVAADGAEVAVAALWERITAVRGLRLAATGDELPLAVTVQPFGSSGPEWAGIIGVRHSLHRPGARHWYTLGGGLMVALVAAMVLWRLRNATVGELLLVTETGVRRVPIRREGLTIGSDRGNRLRLANRMVSRHHAIIRWREGHLVLTDLRSTRGTAVNGRSVVTHQLVSGDRILVGREVELEFRKARSRGRRHG